MKKADKPWVPWFYRICEDRIRDTLNLCTGKYRKYLTLVALALSIAKWHSMSGLMSGDLAEWANCGLCVSTEERLPAAACSENNETRFNCDDCILPKVGECCIQGDSTYKRWSVGSHTPKQHKAMYDMLYNLYREEYEKVM